MKYFAVFSLSLTLLACQGNTQEKAELKTQQDSVSYCIGLDIGKNLKQQSIDVNPEALARGLKDRISGDTLLLTNDQVQATLVAFQTRMRAKQEEKMKAAGEKGKKDGEAFLAENKKDKDVVTLPSGLQYKILTKGSGKKPTEKQTVRVHYRGTLIDGNEFDSSYKRGEPAVFPVNGVIKGWTEALQLMPVGSKWKLFVPSELAYGEAGAGPTIPPNSTLIFEVELLSIQE
jgi:FKBP-type peptidyl-prolyl cis-trans isomerase FklB